MRGEGCEGVVRGVGGGGVREVRGGGVRVVV